TPHISTLSLHDALPISSTVPASGLVTMPQLVGLTLEQVNQQLGPLGLQPKIVEERPDANATVGKVLEQRPAAGTQISTGGFVERSEEHTSELQSLAYLV